MVKIAIKQIDTAFAEWRETDSGQNILKFAAQQATSDIEHLLWAAFMNGYIAGADALRGPSPKGTPFTVSPTVGQNGAPE